MFYDAGMNASPLRVCSFESRRQDDMFRLVQKAGGLPVNAPSMREIPLSDNAAVFDFADQLLSGNVDIIIFMTGVGTVALMDTLAERQLDVAVCTALGKQLVVARGPKPFAALSKLKIRVDIKAPEPNTWEELVGELEKQHVELSGKRVAVQEYGAPGQDLYRWLEAHGAEVLAVPVYRWALPENLEPLKESIRQTVAGNFDVLLWTSAQQLNHVLDVAETLGLKQAWLQAANQCMIGSIGPTASERLRSLGLPPDLEPSHPKMAHLAIESLQQAREILSQKRSQPGSL